MAETKLGKDAVTLPVGTTAQRPSNPEPGMIRFNTDEGYVEWYDDVGDRWVPTSSFPGVVATGGTVTEITRDGQLFRVHTFTSDGTFEVVRGGDVDVLVVGAGGAGGGLSTCGSGNGGGGGAGGLVFKEGEPVSETNYTVEVGDSANYIGSNGTNSNQSDDSSALGYTAVGGGPGQANADSVGSPPDGGSGGGAGTCSAGGSSTNGTPGGALQPGTNPDADIDAGHGGGNQVDSSIYRGGGGGGAAERGRQDNEGAHGGDGIDMSAFFGTSFGEDGYFAGGGGGGSNTTSGGINGAGNGGLGGGGDGAEDGGRSANPPIANTGGGGAGSASSGNDGTEGAEGIVIIRYRVG